MIVVVLVWTRCPTRFQVLDLVYFSNLRSWDRSVIHSGDEREGDEVGDDEKITVDLPRVDSRVQYLGFVVNSYSGHTLNSVASAKCHLFNTHTLEDAASYTITGLKSFNSCALVMCCLYRVGEEWYMHAIGEGAHGTMAKDNVDELQEFLRRTQLQAHRAATGGPPGLAHANQRKPDLAVKVPPGVAAGQKLMMNTPDGYQVAVAVPVQATPGTTIHVAQPMIYTDNDPAFRQ